MLSGDQNKVNKQLPRAIIIVDSSILIKLSAPVSKAYILPSVSSSQKSIRLLETLTLLARSGFKILIPEMVTYETASLLDNCFDISSEYFSNFKKPPSSQCIKSFLKKSLDAGLVEIVPPLSKDQTLPAIYIRSLHSIRNSRNSIPDKRLSIIMETRRHETKHYGEVAAHQLILSMPVTPTPIFYLSDDCHALDTAVNMRHDLPVHKLTSINFLGSLFDNNLFSKMGIKVTQTGQLINDIYLYAQSNGERTGFPFHQKYTNPRNQAAFSTTLAGIFEALQAQEITVSPSSNDEQATLTAPTGVSRFMKKHQNLVIQKLN
jgi:hypothetical protein